MANLLSPELDLIKRLLLSPKLSIFFCLSNEEKIVFLLYFFKLPTTKDSCTFKKDCAVEDVPIHVKPIDFSNPIVLLSRDVLSMS